MHCWWLLTRMKQLPWFLCGALSDDITWRIFSYLWALDFAKQNRLLFLFVVLVSMSNHVNFICKIWAASFQPLHSFCMACHGLSESFPNDPQPSLSVIDFTTKIVYTKYRFNQHLLSSRRISPSKWCSFFKCNFSVAQLNQFVRNDNQSFKIHSSDIFVV